MLWRGSTLPCDALAPLAAAGCRPGWRHAAASALQLSVPLLEAQRAQNAGGAAWTPRRSTGVRGEGSEGGTRKPLTSPRAAHATRRGLPAASRRCFDGRSQALPKRLCLPTAFRLSPALRMLHSEMRRGQQRWQTKRRDRHGVPSESGPADSPLQLRRNGSSNCSVQGQASERRCRQKVCC